MQRLSEEDITGTSGKQGLLEQYLTLSRNSPARHRSGAEEVCIGNKRLTLHTLSDTDDLPGTVTFGMKSYRPTAAIAVYHLLHPSDYAKLQSYLQPISLY